jgi:hypothetical protein
MNGERTGSRWTAGLMLGAVLTLAAMLAAQSLLHPTPAYGQIPDSGAQRERMIRELTAANKQLKEATTVLKEIRDLQKQTAAERGKDGSDNP